LNNEVLISCILSVPKWGCMGLRKCCTVGRGAVILRYFRWSLP